jgi:hypothetical protein
VAERWELVLAGRCRGGVGYWDREGRGGEDTLRTQIFIEVLLARAQKLCLPKWENGKHTPLPVVCFEMERSNYGSKHGTKRVAREF